MFSAPLEPNYTIFTGATFNMSSTSGNAFDCVSSEVLSFGKRMSKIMLRFIDMIRVHQGFLRTLLDINFNPFPNDRFLTLPN